MVLLESAFATANTALHRFLHFGVYGSALSEIGTNLEKPSASAYTGSFTDDNDDDEGTVHVMDDNATEDSSSTGLVVHTTAQVYSLAEPEDYLTTSDDEDGFSDGRLTLRPKAHLHAAPAPSRYEECRSVNERAKNVTTTSSS